ncbi:hypothetical protein ABD91_20005 [Lysinibacillus sphaericus]|uniref:hypothetical protein n=1 Tax=Lysinibacillus sphaericus TaxID=1421 RepID=UPI0018CC8BDC|nr:hypothetical protein [Lysinibacillus sphaericus]MBG9693045.1 hypothetical protein [Lysinibacillus sphaericus]
MSNRIPEIGTFFDTKNLNTLWDFVAVLLKYVAPGVMIFVAITAVGLIIKLVIKTWRKGDEDDDDRRKKDDEYETKYY